MLISNDQLAKLLALRDYFAAVIDWRLVSLILFLAGGSLAIILVWQLRGRANLRWRAGMAQSVLGCLDPGKQLENSLCDFLNLIAPLIKADGYYFYLREPRETKYQLKALRYTSEQGEQLVVGYHRLVPYQKETYNPPLSLAGPLAAGQPMLIKDGEVPLLDLPIPGGAGMIRVGPVHRAPRKLLAKLAYFCQQLKPVLETVGELGQMNSQVKAITASNEAIRAISSLTMDSGNSLAALLGLSFKLIDAAGGCLLHDPDNAPRVAVFAGLDAKNRRLLEGDQEGLSRLAQLTPDNDGEILWVETGLDSWQQAPETLKAAGMQVLLLVRAGSRGTVVYWYPTAPALEQHRLAALHVLTRRLGDAVEHQLQAGAMSAAYLGTLQALVTMFDNLEPQTVGHSELIARYAAVIALEQGMENSAIQEVMLAGYLHDVGMLGLSSSLIFKEGKYTGVEQAAMKLHAEVGAAILELTVANQTLANYVRSHHERWDGFGYPAGLKGEEIPLGARMIAVADMFTAKITGRKYRDPVPMGEAINHLRAAAGSQLDQEMVETLAGWFTRKQAEIAEGRSLGACWEIRCCPPGTASRCPASNQPATYCWQVPGTNCAAHGNTCSTCMVYTGFNLRHSTMVLN